MHGPIAPLAPCTQKTATQIALEQIEYISEVEYVGRVRDFMAASPKDLIQRGMEQMHAVIGPAKERMAADFTDSDLYMTMDIFDLDEWEPLVPLASTQSLLSAPGTSALRLARNLRTILDNYSPEHKTIDDWVFVVLIPIRHRTRLMFERPRRSSKVVLDHRVSWALALSEIAQNHPWVDVPVRAYLAWIDGTGSVERGLGAHTAVLASHTGKRSETPKDYIEMVTEMRWDGPKDANDILCEGAGGEPSPVVCVFAKDCAALWIRIRGRRFGSCKKRKDAGVKKEKRQAWHV